MADPAASSQPATSRALNMRYYENELPQVGELVHVRYTSMTDNSAYVQLLEYANIQGMITFAELHRGRITSISHYASVGREDILTVLRLDEEKRYIDLSKRTLKTPDKDAGNQKAQRGRDVLNYMCTVADACQYPLESLMKKVVWPLYEKYPKTDSNLGGALEGLKRAVTNSDEVFAGLDIPANVRKELDRIIQAKLKPKPRKYESEVSVTCTTVEGVESIKAVLIAGQAQSKGAVNITVKASPHFLLRTSSTDRDEALRTLVSCIDSMKEASQKLSVNIEVDKEPCDVGAG